MRTIRLSTAYQLFLTALLLGACLGIVSRQLPASLSTGVAQAQSMQNERQAATAPAGTLACCYNGQLIWLDEAAATPVAQLEQWQSTLPAHSPTLPRFTLVEQTRFAEQLTPRLFVFAHAGAEGLANYRVRVRKDGQELPVSQSTYAGTPSYTWPVLHSRQRYTNLKVEFRGVTPAGLWEVELLDAQGTVVAPTVAFQIAPHDPNLEMYVDFQRSE